MVFHLTRSHTKYMQGRKDGKVVHKIDIPAKHRKETLSPNTCHSRWDFEDDCDVKCRVVKFRINDPETGKEEWEVLITNLPCFEFKIPDLKEIYHLRWGIETSFRDVKYSLGAINFHSRKDDFVLMEIYAHLIMFNVVARNVGAVDIPKKERKYAYAIDFKMACAITRKYFRRYCVEPIANLYAELVRYINPVRPGRQDERNIKPKSAISFLYRVA